MPTFIQRAPPQRRGDQRDPPQEKREDEGQPPKPPFKQRVKEFVRSHPTGILVGAIALVALLIGGFFLMSYLNSYESTDDAQVDGHLDPIGARIAGNVTSVRVDDNQFVSAGELLVVLDAHDYQNAQAQANAAYAQARRAA